MAKPEFGDRTLERMGAGADYCRAAETLQRAESRCAALGVPTAFLYLLTQDYMFNSNTYGRFTARDIRHEGERPPKNLDGDKGFSLAEIGVTRNQSSRYQRLFEIPEPAFFITAISRSRYGSIGIPSGYGSSSR